MRLWSLHPKYLDSKGLVALWREALLAKHVLEGNTKGYRNHPQLIRFKALKDPVSGMNQYLSEVHAEAALRGYHFDQGKIGPYRNRIVMTVTSGQLQYEQMHLLRKLAIRDSEYYNRFMAVQLIEHFAIFRTIQGAVEPWEGS